MIKRNWLNSFMFLLMAGGLCTPAFAQGVYRSMCDTAPASAGCASNGAGNGCASNGAGNGYGSNGAGNGCASNGAGNGCASNGYGNGCASNGAGNGCASNGYGGNGSGSVFASGLGSLGSLFNACNTNGGAGDGCGEAESPWNFGGWIQTGYHNKSNGQFNSYPGRFQLHQGYVYAERTVDGSKGFDLGGRIDYVYGTDGPDTQGFGGNQWDTGWDNGGAYGHAIPQVYGEVALGEVMTVKVGHFYTLVGYEVVTAPDNFFYSHAFTMNNGEPFTHTGAIATMPMGDVTAYGGWVQGWDTGFEDAGGSQFMGGFSTDLMEGLNLTYINTIGKIGNFTDNTGYSHSVVFNAAVTDKLNYIFQTDMVDFNSPTNSFADRRAIGVNQYMLYSLTDKIGIGTRTEWWQTELAPGNNADLLAYTVGLNLKPVENVIIRPEVRWNKDNDGFIIPAGNNQDVIFGIDGIIVF